MTKWMLAAGAAALAMASPALAQKGGQGGGNDKGEGGGTAKVERGGGGGQRAERGGGGQQERAERPQRIERQQQRAERPQRAERQQQQRAERPQRVERQQARQERRVERAPERREARQDARQDNRREARQDTRREVRQIDRREARQDLRRDDSREARQDVRRDDFRRAFVAQRDGYSTWRVGRNDANRLDDRFVPRWTNAGLINGYADGCPPGLARKNNGCLPPGQAKKMVGTLLPSYLTGRNLDGYYSDWYRDNDDYYYRYDDDYIYQVGRSDNLIDAFFPYQDRDYYYYPVGMSYPSDYNYYNVPYQYQSYYPDGGDYSYRYGDGAIYQVNSSNGLIQGISALLAGDLSVGQQLPPAYSAYNVPLSYRDQYYDTQDDWYRYNDGNIYQVDPTTQLITAVISAIV